MTRRLLDPMWRAFGPFTLIMLLLLEIAVVLLLLIMMGKLWDLR